MKDFDLLAKKILESEEPQFQNKYWKQFAQRAGIRYVPSLLKPLLYVGGVLLLGGGIGFLAFSFLSENNNKKDIEIIINQIDTIIQNKNEEHLSVMDTIIVPENTNNNQHTTQKRTVSEMKKIQEESNTPIEKQTLPAPPPSKEYWQGVGIMNTDTIKSDY